GGRVDDSTAGGAVTGADVDVVAGETSPHALATRASTSTRARRRPTPPCSPGWGRCTSRERAETEVFAGWSSPPGPGWYVHTRNRSRGGKPNGGRDQDLARRVGDPPGLVQPGRRPARASAAAAPSRHS